MTSYQLIHGEFDMRQWDEAMKPAEFAEFQLVDAILKGDFPIDSTLPAERELAEQLGVTRPTLREVLQRLAKDGWIDIQHGKATRIKNYLVEGNLGVLSSMVRHQEFVSADFVGNLLSFRRLIAPEYTRLAVLLHARECADFLAASSSLSESPSAFAVYDWQVHQFLAIRSENPVFPLLLNGFANLYKVNGELFYQMPGAFDLSIRFYRELSGAIHHNNPTLAESVCRSAMIASEQVWFALAAQKRTLLEDRRQE